MNSTMFMPTCGLCGKSGRLTKTDCCNNWICDDEAEYMMFSYATNSCYRNHNRYTLCSSHYNEGHKGADWRKCKECYNTLDPQTYNWYGTNEFNFVTLQNSSKPKSHSRNVRGQSSGNRIRKTSSKRGKSAKPRATSKRVRSQTKGNKKAKTKITAATLDSSMREEVKHKFGKYGLLPSIVNQRETSNRQKSVSKKGSRGRSKNQKPEQKVKQNSRQRGRSKASSKRTSSNGKTNSTQRKSQTRRAKSNRRTSSNLASSQSQRKSRQPKQSRGRSVNTVNRRETSRSKTNKKQKKSAKRKTVRMWVRTSSPQNRGGRRGSSRSQSKTKQKRGNSTKRRVVRGVWVRSSTPKKAAPRTMWTWYIPELLQNTMWTVAPSNTKKKEKKQNLSSNSRSQEKRKVNKKRKADSILEDASLQPLGGTLIKVPIKRVKKNEEEDFGMGREASPKLVTLTAFKKHVVLYETKNDDGGEESDRNESVVKKKVSGIRKKMNIESQLEVNYLKEKTKLGTTFIDN